MRQPAAAWTRGGRRARAAAWTHGVHVRLLFIFFKSLPCATCLAHGEVDPAAVNSGQRRLLSLFRRVP